jgi:type VI secretion system protein
MAAHNEGMGLLEKFLGPIPGSHDRSPVRWVGDPVRDHLILLLNTRQGSVRQSPDYGMPDVASFYSEYPASISNLRAAVEESIRKYEPRLHNVRVIPDADVQTWEFRVSMVITGEVEEPDGTVRVRYRTTISSSGHADLEVT